jgi:PhoPQ-activated pathogenicity-related protein
MSAMSLRSMALIVAVVPVALFAAEPRQLPSHSRASETALDRYVSAPDPSFTWKVLRELPAQGGIRATRLQMVSQRWLTEQEVERPLWTHWVTVVRPAKVKGGVALLFITGGRLDRKPPESPPDWMVDVARETGTVAAELRLVPNEPVIFKDDPERKPRLEDDFIAYRRRALAGPAADDQERRARDGRGHGVPGFGRRRRRQGRPLRRLRRLEARLDDVDDSGR